MLSILIVYALYNNQKRHRGLGVNGIMSMQKQEECKSVTLMLQCHNNLTLDIEFIIV